MSAREQHTAFDGAHPAVAAVYVVFTLGLTMFSMQPVLIGISLIGGLVYGCCARGWRACLQSLRWQLPFILLIAVANPLFVSSGSTELFRIGLRAVYLEAFVYGCAMGGLFVASVLWFQAAGCLLSFEAVMALFGNAAPTIALMVSMCMRLIPRFVRQGQQIAGVQDVVLKGGAGDGASEGSASDGSAPGGAVSDSGTAGHGHGAGGSGVGAAPGGTAAGVGAVARARLRQSTVLMGWAMEDSLETADAMRARGWGAGRRSTYVRYRFCSADAGAVIALAVAGVLCVALAYTATAQYRFYPSLSELTAWWGYLPYAMWMLLPTALHLRERRRFS